MAETEATNVTGPMISEGPGPPRYSESPGSDSLDPRVQEELERLNKASNDINKLEFKIDEARAYFRQLMTESTQKLDALTKKLGTCIEKARPYYEARMKAKEAQIETQKAALRFERACSQLAVAKEMEYLAEQGYLKRGETFDPAWQEMLNHATMKVNESEQERWESEVDHKQTALVFNEAEQRVKIFQKDLKRVVAKSKMYFETKAQYNQAMEEQKQHIGSLEKKIGSAKFAYSEALRCLESISDQIHQQRKDAKARKELGWRRPGVGAETPMPPPEQNLPSNQPSHIHSSQTDTQSHYHPLADISQVNVIVGEPPKNAKDINIMGKKTDTQMIPAESMPDDAIVKSNITSDNETLNKENGENSEDKDEVANSRASFMKAPMISVSELEGQDGGAKVTTNDNAEIMRNIQQAKEGKLAYLHPRLSSDNLLDDMSDTDSIGESIASGTMLDDQQIENLMLETIDYASVLDNTSQVSQDDLKRNSLPPSLSYLENYVHFRQDEESKDPERPDGNGSSIGDDTSQNMHKTDEEVVLEKAEGDTRDNVFYCGETPLSPVDEEVEFARKRAFKMSLNPDEELEYFV